MPSLFTRIAPLMAAALATCAAAQAAANPDTVRVIVRFDGASARTVATRDGVATLRGKVKLDLPHLQAMAVELPKANLAALQRMPGVTSVEVDAPRYLQSFADSPSDGTLYAAGQRVPYGIRMIQADQMPQGDALAGNMKVCIVDSGLDTTHPDLQGVPVTGNDNKLHGKWDQDDIGHGTHIAGTIAAVNNAGVGVVGVLPNKKVSLHIENIYGIPGGAPGARGQAKGKGPGDAYASDVADALKRCQAAGAKVYSLSIAGDLKSKAEEDTFNQIYAAGGLFLVAMGNQGTRELWYPAGYNVSIGVAAIDANKQWATFSQFPSNGKVELAAPGVDVLSTLPASIDPAYGDPGVLGSLTVDGQPLASRATDGSLMHKAVTAPLADFKDGQWEDPAMAGKICLISKRARTSGFVDAVAQRCQKSGGVGFVIMQNAKAYNLSTFVREDSGGLIPGVAVERAVGRRLIGAVGRTATLRNTPWPYAYFGGTSMATPHAAAAAALVWSYFPQCTNQEIRTALHMGAEDVNAPGRDIYTGYGIVRARASHDYLKAHGCAADRQAAAPATARKE